MASSRQITLVGVKRGFQDANISGSKTSSHRELFILSELPSKGLIPSEVAENYERSLRFLRELSMLSTFSKSYCTRGYREDLREYREALSELSTRTFDTLGGLREHWRGCISRYYGCSW